MSPGTQLSILFEDNHLLVINKPVGLATMGVSGGGNNLHSLACDYLRRKYGKPGKVYLGVVHRLDSMTSGTVVFARTSKAAGRLSEQFRRGSSNETVMPPTKVYLAVIQGILSGSRETFCDWVLKDDRNHRMRIVSPKAMGAMKAVLRFRQIDSATEILGQPVSLLSVELLTGRKHQIRVQFADRGHPVVGDIKYDGRRSKLPGIALHSWSLSIDHPITKTRLSFVSPVPDAWIDHFSEIKAWPTTVP